MSNLLKEKCVLALLRAELEERLGKLCYEYKKFRHLARNYRNRREMEERTSISQNKFEVLPSRVMRCGVEIRRQKRERKEEKVIQCFKYRKEGYQ